MRVTEKLAVDLSGVDLGRQVTVEVLGTTVTGTLRSVSHYPVTGTVVGMVVELPDGTGRHLDAQIEGDAMVRLLGKTSSA